MLGNIYEAQDLGRAVFRRVARLSSKSRAVFGLMDVVFYKDLAPDAEVAKFGIRARFRIS